MSNGTLNGQGEHPERQTDSPDARDVRLGVEAGFAWATIHAGTIERESLWAILTGARPEPRLSSCSSADEAIHELVRSIHPPCGLHADSARAYWESIHGGYPVSGPFVEGFFEGACDAVDDYVSEGAHEIARGWIRTRDWRIELEQVQQFVEQYSDTWQDAYPEGCSTAFDVLLRMAGRLESAQSDDAVSAFHREFDAHIEPDIEFAWDTEEFARRMIAGIIQFLPSWRAYLERTSEHQESQVPDSPPQPESAIAATSQRQLRGIRFRRQPPQPEPDSEEP